MGAAEARPPREILQAAKEVLAHEAATYLRLLLAFRDGRVQELMAELMAGGEGGDMPPSFRSGGGRGGPVGGALGVGGGVGGGGGCCGTLPGSAGG